MKTPFPTQKEIYELVSYLPKLYAEGFKPIKKWYGMRKNKDGICSLPWPEYEEVVTDFFKAASKKCWLDYAYHPESLHMCSLQARQFIIVDKIRASSPPYDRYIIASSSFR